MSASRAMLIAALSLAVATVWGQSNRKQPYIGYVYPAGGQQGSGFQVTVGGQNLQGATGAYVTGEGVHASVIEYVRPLSKKQLRDVAMHLRVQMRQRWAEVRGKAAPAAPRKEDKPAADDEELPALPDHPWLRDLDKKSLRELNDLRSMLFDPKQQPNAQIAEWVLVDIQIAPEAALGDRELRLTTPQGLTDPLRFEVGLLPEVCEQEPNALQEAAATALEVPVVLNGQIMPGDTDAFRFRAAKGRKLVIAAQARSLVPYLADAVPGWFQAVLALYDAQGKEAAFADDYRFDPDPVLFYETPADGEYLLEIRDAIYRGREDFVYRIAVTEQPFITQMFPLGGRTGSDAKAAIAGWNLPCDHVQLDAQPGPDHFRQARWRWDAGLSNALAYAVDTLPEGNETEPNDAAKKAQRIAPPCTVNGRIGRSGDVDVFQFAAHAGDEVVAEVYARRLGSPLDSLLRLTDAAGRVLVWNDDHEDKKVGLLTHHADSYLSARIEQAGTYTLHLSDAQHHGGDEYAYRLRIGPPQPDFALRMVPSSLSVFAGRAAAFTVYVLRQDGFDGDIEVALSDPPAGFALNGGRIPAGRDGTRMTLTAPRQPLEQPVALQLAGHAQVGQEVVSRPVIPAENMMQAFAYWHLVPSQTLMALVMSGRRFAPAVELLDEGPVRIPKGGTAQVQLRAPAGPMLEKLRLELSEPPGGVTLREVNAVTGGLVLVLQADAKTAQAGYADNLIVDVSVGIEAKGRDGKVRKVQVSLGVLEAIPFEIVE